MAEKSKCSVLIGADIVPTASNAELFSSGNIQELIGSELSELINEASYTIFNLEVPLVDSETPILKCGPALSAPTSTVHGLCAINKGAFTLANNHILDQGQTALESTMELLDAGGVSHFGAGSDLKMARVPHEVVVGEKRIGFYGCAEHEFSIAGECRAGANPFNVLTSYDDVARLKKACDYVVVLYHGGKEHYRYPSPLLQKRCRKFVEVGADLVVCQHSHCVGCEEHWKNGTIVYGQGNFLFDDEDDEYWRSGLLIEVELLDEPKIKYHPLVKDAERVRMAHGDKASEILSSFNDRSREIVEPGFVEQKYTEYAMTYIDSYLASCIPGSRTIIFRVLNKLCGGTLPRKLLGKEKLLSLLNHIECEAHSELGIAGLRALTNTGQAC